MNRTRALSPCGLPVALQSEAGGAPEWVQLLPVADGEVATHDGRGPYRVEDAAALIAASMEDPRGLPIDQDHATDLAAPLGMPAPARGWIRAMEVRGGAVWAQVEWTAEGAALVASRAYRGISPVFVTGDGGSIRRILRASLVNTPNLRGLALLNAESDTMNLLAMLAEELGLDPGAAGEDVLAAVRALREGAGQAVAMQARLAELGTALGVAGDEAEVMAAARMAGATLATVADLNVQLAAAQARIAEMDAAARRAASEEFVDRAIRELRAGVNAGNRDELVALHMEAPQVVERMIAAAPRLGPSGARAQPPVPRAGDVALSAEQSAALAALGVGREAYLETLRNEQEAR